MKSIMRLIFVASMFLLTTPVLNAQITNEDFLKADGTVLRNNAGTGDTINLRGTNLGAWLSMEYWMGPLGKGSLDRSNWEATASSTFSGTSLQDVFDRDLSTRWANGEAQLADSSQYFMVDMKENVLFNRVSFEAENFTGDYPRSFSIEVSENGNDWETIASGEGQTENIYFQLPNLYFKRYIKITQTGSAPNNFWSIAEFNLYMEDDFTVRNALNLRFGEDQTDSLLDNFQEAWIQASDLDYIKNMGMNMVRVPVYWMELMYNDGTIKPQAFDQLDWVINACAARDIYVIIDLHGAPGGINGFITSGQAYFNNYWESSAAQQRTINIWKAIAQRYKNNPTVAAYDLLNEPLSSDQEQYPIHTFYNDLYQEVRAIDPDHVISIGAFPNFDFVVPPEQYGWENVLYQVHHYNEDKTNYQSQKGFIDAITLDVANRMYNWNVPVLAGEFNFWDFPDLWADYLSTLNALNVSWSNWAYKVKRVDSPKENWGYYDSATFPIPNIHYDPYDTIAKKWSRFKTEDFNVNQDLIDIVTPHTTHTVSKPPLGKTIWIKANNGSYLSSEGNDNPMTFTRDSVANWETFKVVDAGDGFIALLGSNTKYVSAESNQLFCNSETIGSAEKFNFIQFGNQQIGLRGHNNKYISSENGQMPATCNRETMGGWELFEWGEITSGTLSSPILQSNKTIAFKVAPNPTDSMLTISTTAKNYNLEVIDSNGIIHKTKTDLHGESTIDLSSLASGLYFIRFSYLDKLITHKIILN